MTGWSLTTFSSRRTAATYSAKIISSSETGRFVVAEVARPEAVPIDPRGYTLPRRHVICKAAQLLQANQNTRHSPLSNILQIDPNPFSLLEEYAASLPWAITPSEVSEILKSLTCPLLALRFFRFCPSLFSGFRHDAFNYTRMLLILSKSELPNKRELVLDLISEMQRKGVRGTISTVNVLIGYFGDVDDLDRWIGLIRKWSLAMNGYTYKCLVASHLRARDCERGFLVYVEMKKKEFGLDIFGYNMLLDALVRDGKVDEAREVFNDMVKKKCEPDEYTYTIMIKMTGNMGEGEESLAIFEKMLNNGCVPGVIAYNTVMQALANAAMIDKLLLLFSKMITRNCRPNEFSYSIILFALVNSGQLHRLDGVIEMSKKYASRLIYAWLIRTLNKLGYASEAHRQFCNMWNYHGRGDRGAFVSMIESLCNAGKITEAMDLLDRIHQKGVNAETVMYNTILSAVAKRKEIWHLCDLYERMKRDGPSPDIFTYNILISAFGRAGRVRDAIDVFDELEKSHCEPDVVSYNALINCLGKNGDLDEAHMRFCEMPEKGLNPDVVTYSTLIECFGKTDRVEMARKLFHEMLDNGCRPNIVTYNILLDCLQRCGRTADAVELYDRLKQQGLSPDRITSRVLVRLRSGSNRKSRVRRQHPITGWVVSSLR